MKILVHFHFSILLKIEKGSNNPLSKFIFHFFVKMKMKTNRILFEKNENED